MKNLFTDGKASILTSGRVLLLAVILISIPVSNYGQNSRSRKGKAEANQSQKVQPRTPRDGPSSESSETAPKEIETLKIDTNLVTVPVIATDINGLYIPNLRRDEFELSEDDVKQELTFFATVNVPFHVVLMLDTSASTKEKLGLIQQAAVAFVEQLQSADRVKVISFADSVQELNEFTNDRALLASAILNTRSGEGTKLYDAFELALSTIRKIPGRKAIVLFSDGVDWHSDSASFDGTLRGLDEEGVIVYPIRYNTREETERIARQQSEAQVPILPTIGVIRTRQLREQPPPLFRVMTLPQFLLLAHAARRDRLVCRFRMRFYDVAVKASAIARMACLARTVSHQPAIRTQVDPIAEMIRETQLVGLTPKMNRDPHLRRQPDAVRIQSAPCWTISMQ